MLYIFGCIQIIWNHHMFTVRKIKIGNSLTIVIYLCYSMVGKNIGHHAKHFFLQLENLLWDHACPFFLSFSFPLCLAAWRILVPWPGTEPTPSALKVRNLNLFMAREVPKSFSIFYPGRISLWWWVTKFISE